MRKILFVLRFYREKVAIILSVAFLCNLMLPALAMAIQDEEQKEAQCYNQIAQLYLPSLVEKETVENEMAQKIKEYNADLKPNDRKNFKLHKVGEVEGLRLLYQIFASHQSSTDKVNENVLNKNILNDLNVFCGDKSDLENSLFAHLDNTQTSIGRIQLQKMLFQPITDISELKKRQSIVRKLITDKALFDSLDENLQEIKMLESEIAWFWKALEKEVFNYFNRLYFQKPSLRGLNTNSIAMELNNDVLNLGGGYLLMFLMSCAVMIGLERGGVFDDRSIILASLFAGYFTIIRPAMTLIVAKIAGMPNIIDEILGNIETTREIQQKMIDVAAVENNIQKIAEELKSSGKFFQRFLPLKQDDEQAQDFLNLLNKNTFKGQPSLFSFNGRVLSAFKRMYEVKDALIGQLKEVGQLDAYLSIAKLYKKHANNINARYSFAEYIERTDKPCMEITNFWHPMLDPKKVVTNSIELGKNKCSSVVLTGPNAAGKSKCMEAVTINLILAQSFGIAPSRKIRITPFSLINTYKNITDSTGKESLFQAEMNRAKALLEAIRNNGFSFVIMDEIFTGTNPKEGAAGAYGVAKKVASFKNSIAIIATHYPELTTLEEDTNGLINNYKVSVDRDLNGKIIFHYRLERGVTSQDIALELLQDSGFDSDILLDAYNVLNIKKQAAFSSVANSVPIEVAA